MPLYFAYGANMDRQGMAERCPASRPLGLGRLKRFRFVVTADGYASVVRDGAAETHGVVWDLALCDVAALDRYEEVDRGLYVKAIQPVFTDAGPKKALVYFATSVSLGPPKPGYLEAVIASAESWGLPSPYLAEMRRWSASPSRRLM